MSNTEDFKVVSSNWRVEAKCPKCGRYIHPSRSLAGYSQDMAKGVSQMYTARFKCYCGHRGFLNFKDSGAQS